MMFRMSLKNVGSPGGEVHGMSERHAYRVVDHHWPINSLSTILRNALSRTSFPSQQKCQPRLRFLFLFSLSEKGRWKLRKSAASEVAFFGANRPRRELHEWKTPSTREDSRNQAKGETTSGSKETTNDAGDRKPDPPCHSTGSARFTRATPSSK